MGKKENENAFYRIKKSRWNIGDTV